MRETRRLTEEINQGEVRSPTAQLMANSHRIPRGNVADGTKIAQTKRAQPNIVAVSITNELAVIEREMPALAASCNLDTTASSPVGK